MVLDNSRIGYICNFCSGISFYNFYFNFIRCEKMIKRTEYERIQYRVKKLEAENEKVKEIVERIMTQHWDMAACRCWVCVLGREAGCRAREGYPTNPLGSKEFGRVTVKPQELEGGVE